MTDKSDDERVGYPYHRFVVVGRPHALNWGAPYRLRGCG